MPTANRTYVPSQLLFATTPSGWLPELLIRKFDWDNLSQSIGQNSNRVFSISGLVLAIKLFISKVLMEEQSQPASPPAGRYVRFLRDWTRCAYEPPLLVTSTKRLLSTLGLILVDCGVYIGLKLSEISEKESQRTSYMGENSIGCGIRNWTVVEHMHHTIEERT